MNIAKALELEKTAQFTSEWEGEEFTFTAKAHKLTPKIMQQFADSADKPVEFAAVAADVLTEWSLDWNGQPFPPTVENISQLPYEFINHILDKVGASWSGNESKPSASASGSAAAGK